MKILVTVYVQDDKNTSSSVCTRVQGDKSTGSSACTRILAVVHDQGDKDTRCSA